MASVTYCRHLIALLLLQNLEINDINGNANSHEAKKPSKYDLHSEMNM